MSFHYFGNIEDRPGWSQKIADTDLVPVLLDASEAEISRFLRNSASSDAGAVLRDVTVFLLYHSTSRSLCIELRNGLKRIFRE